MATKRICSVPDCGKPHEAKGYCNKHYLRLKIHGDPLVCKQKQAANGELMNFYLNVVVPFQGEECLIWPYSTFASGYGEIHHDGKNKRVHRLACEARHGPPPTPKHQAAHSCGKGHEGCCNPRHLRWATRTENESDKVRHGTSNRGERNGHHKLTEEDVRQILTLKGRMKTVEIAKKYSVSHATISNIYSRKCWRHVR